MRLLYGLLYRDLLKCFQLAVAVFTWLCAVYVAYGSHWQAVPSLLNVFRGALYIILLVCHLRVTVGESVLCCCVCVTSFDS